MHMDYGLRQELHQKLIMTPQLRQAIAILQLSSIDLAELVEKELLENPVLEAEAKQPEQISEEETSQSDHESRAEEYVEWAEYFDGPGTGAPAPEDQKSKSTFEAYVSTAMLLHEHLEFQLHLAVLDDKARKIGEYLIGCIDDNGYLRIDIVEAANNLKVDLKLVEQTLAVIQTFDPTGVGARDLKECLIIQAKQRNIDNPLVLRLINSHLDDIAAGKFKGVADKLGCTPHDIQQSVDIIRSLDPKPGRAFGSAGQSLYITPDVTVERVNGNYVILINDYDIPHLTVNPYYRQIVRDADNEARKFVEGRINAAVWFIKSIEQRRRTLYKVMEAIIELQRDFFDRGPKHLKPLTMKKVADQTGVHESTVSRATANKYVATPHGLFSLRTFFSAAVSSAAGADVAASRIKRDIKELIAAEDATQPLSDQALADIFAERGVAVSRRTVAKYREELGIVSSAKRKRY